MYSSRRPSNNGKREKKIIRGIAVAAVTIVNLGCLLCSTPESSRFDCSVAAEGSRVSTASASLSESAARGRAAGAFVAIPSSSSARAPSWTSAPPPVWGLPDVSRARRSSRCGGRDGVGLHVTTRRQTEEDADSAVPSSTPSIVDRSGEATSFYSYLESCGPVASANLDRVALGNFPLPGTADSKIRGVVALKPIRKGEVILRIPYEMALNLGKCGRDPTLPAYNLLQEICRAHSGEEDDTGNRKVPKSRKKADIGPYLATLPKFLGRDCLDSPLFFSDEALDALQVPFVKEEMLARREIVALRYERDVAPMTQIGDGSLFELDPGDGGGVASATEGHLCWAVWLASSRCITLPGAEGSDGSPALSFRLMVPLIDMCNHDRDSPHVLEGGAEPGGTIRIVAGKDVESGEQINICYGSTAIGNDRLLQDYGFLDTNVEGYSVVARQLLGEQWDRKQSDRTTETLTSADRKEALVTLQQTSTEEDRSLLEDAVALARDIRIAVEFRLGVKSALVELE